jgi:glycerol uptake facilitator-like aquaporin
LAASVFVGIGFGLNFDEDAVDAVALVAAFLLLLLIFLLFEAFALGGGGINPATGTGDKVLDFLLGIAIGSH